MMRRFCPITRIRTDGFFGNDRGPGPDAETRKAPALSRAEAQSFFLEVF